MKMGKVMKQNEDGSWSEATPLPVFGKVAMVEFWLRDKGFKTIPNLLAKWDERALGK